jgi:hypothetical protein
MRTLPCVERRREHRALGHRRLGECCNANDTGEPFSRCLIQTYRRCGRRLRALATLSQKTSLLAGVSRPPFWERPSRALPDPEYMPDEQCE